MAQQGDLALLDEPVAKALLSSALPARLAYTWRDGSPRVVPIWFTWTGQELVFGSPPRAPKVQVLQERPEVAVSIDTAEFPYQVLSLRGSVRVDLLEHVAPEYEQASLRYFGAEQGRAWADQLRDQPMARIALVPTWAALIDFESGRLPSALSA